jgi:peptide deformylase
MAVQKLVTWTDPVLRNSCGLFDFNNPPMDPIQLATDLTETMLSNDGLGLAAPQIGVPYRVFAMKANPVLVIFNPKIVHWDEAIVELPEGCLSFPGMMVKLKRPASIRARFQLPNSKVETHRYEGFTARIFQHEYDHLEGVLMFDRVSRVKRDMAMRKWELFMKKRARAA